MRLNTVVAEGQTARFHLRPSIAKAKQIYSRELVGTVLRTTAMAVEVRAFVELREAQACLACGQELTHPISRLVGFGPICCDRLGIPRPDKMTAADVAALKERVKRETLTITWLPRSQIRDIEVFGVSHPPVPRLPHEPPPPPSSTPRQPRIVDHTGAHWVLSFAYDAALVETVKAQLPGRRWVQEAKTWVVPNEEAKAVRDLANKHGFEFTDAALEALAAGLDVDSLVNASSASTSDFEVAGLAMTLRPYQRAGVAYATRQKRVIIGDQPGLGKTAQALATLEHLGAYPALVVCPASLKLNWQAEVKMWLPHRSVAIHTGTAYTPVADVVVVNYDVLHRIGGEVIPRSVVFDESHRIKNRLARRTKAALSIAEAVRHRHKAEAVVLCLTGTAILNRPTELAAQLEALGRLSDFCGPLEPGQSAHFAFADRWGNASARILRELNRKMRSTCYIRREKADVLAELPDKARVVVPLEIDNREEYDRAESELITYLREKAVADTEFRKSIAHLDRQDRIAALSERAQSAEEKARRGEHLVRINVLKRLVAQGKLAAATRWVGEFLGGSDQKMVLFGHHLDVVEGLGKTFKADTITGNTSLPARDRAVRRFQQDPAARVIALNMQAGGEGLTLTAASDVTFFELGWTAAVHDQCEDRCHRFGQKDSVTCYYLIGDRTIEARIAKLIDSKRALGEAVLIGKESPLSESVLTDLLNQLRGRAATEEELEL